MKDFPAQLLDLAKELQESAPKGLQDPKGWMKQAGDFADACMVSDRLHPHVTDEELAVGDPTELRKRAAARLKKLSSRASIELRSTLTSIATGKGYFTMTGKEART